MGLTIYLITIDTKKITFDLGPEYSRLMGVSAVGTNKSESLGQPAHITTLEENNLSSKNFIGLRTELSWKIKLKKWIISPQYGFYYGLGDEFRFFGEKISSLRQNLGFSFEFN